MSELIKRIFRRKQENYVHIYDRLKEIVSLMLKRSVNYSYVIQKLPKFAKLPMGFKTFLGFGRKFKDVTMSFVVLDLSPKQNYELQDVVIAAVVSHGKKIPFIFYMQETECMKFVSLDRGVYSVVDELERLCLWAIIHCKRRGLLISMLPLPESS